MRDRGLRPPEYSCSCGFELWNPLAASEEVAVGLYDDARFPGRLIVSVRRQYSHLEDMPAAEASRFMLVLQQIMSAQRRVLDADRINIAILGNQEPHVHAHLVPRGVRAEPLPDKAPWEDPRPRQRLPKRDKARLTVALTEALSALGLEPYRGQRATECRQPGLLALLK